MDLQPSAKEIKAAEQIVEYGKLYLQRKAEGVGLQDVTPLEKRHIFLYMLAFRMFTITGQKEDPDAADMTDEEFIASREARVRELKGE